MKTAIVTGASGGIGNAIAQGLVESGVNTYLIDIKPFYIPCDHMELRDDIHLVQGDITRESFLEELVSHIDKIDILINNAGLGKGTFDDIINVNLKAPYNLIKLVSKKMIERGNGGTIVNITSLGADMGFPDNPSYCASKGGLKAMTKAFAYDLSKHGIRINNVCPSYINTNFHEGRNNGEEWKLKRLDRTMIKRLGEPKDVVGAVLFLCSDASSYITGTDIYVDGGWSAKGL